MTRYGNRNRVRPKIKTRTVLFQISSIIFTILQFFFVLSIVILKEETGKCCFFLDSTTFFIV
jgi:cytochrome c-type biogenesis protein CcmH/NrfF